MQHIFVVEGFTGYPFGKPRVPRKIHSTSEMVCGISPSQMLNFVLPLIDTIPDVKWYYYPQFMVGPIIRNVRRILREIPNDHEPPVLKMIGFSFGGSAVHRVSHAFREPTFELVVSLDPVGKWRWNVTPENPNAYGFRKPPSVRRWVNLYQRIDRSSICLKYPPFRKAIWGGRVAGADSEIELLSDDFQPSRIYNNGSTTHGLAELTRSVEQAHLWFPAQNDVQNRIVHEFEITE